MTHSVPLAARASTRQPVVGFNGWFWTQSRTGSGQYLQQLVAALHRLPAGVRTVVYVSAMHTPAAGAKHAGATIVPLSTPFDRLNEDLAKLWFEQIAVPRACRRSKVDILHVPYWATPAVSVAPVVTTVHDVIPIVLPVYRSSMPVRLYTRFVTWTMRRSAVVLADSDASGQDILRTTGVPAGRLRVVHLAVGPQYQPVEDRERLRAVQEKYGLPRRFVLYLGGFDPRKNVPRLIRAYGQMAGACESAPDLVIAGRLPEQPTAFFSDPREDARRTGKSEQVHFVGEVAEDDKPALYSLATCFVFPSLYEGFGLPVLEAMACGAPVVTSCTSSLGELAGDAALLVDPCSEAEIAGAMGRLIAEPATRAEYAGRGRERARQFSWNETARLTMQAYQDILSVQTESNPRIGANLETNK